MAWIDPAQTPRGRGKSCSAAGALCRRIAGLSRLAGTISDRRDHRALPRRSGALLHSRPLGKPGDACRRTFPAVPDAVLERPLAWPGSASACLCGDLGGAAIPAGFAWRLFLRSLSDRLSPAATLCLALPGRLLLGDLEFQSANRAVLRGAAVAFR